VLAQLEEMTVPEIAELLGANVNTVYARLRTARREFDAAYARHRARSASTERRVP
jgi:RNA polymerase sigma-70 factor (ECF subfamily)